MSDLLYHSAAHIVRDALVAPDIGGGSFPAENGHWPIFINNEPDKPDECITIYDTRRYHQGRMMRSGLLNESGEVDEAFGILIRVRSSTIFLGANKINSLAKIVDTLIHTVIVIVVSQPGTGNFPAIPYHIKNFSRRGGGTGSRGSDNYYLGKERKQPSTNDVVSFSNRDIFTLSGRVTIRMV